MKSLGFVRRIRVMKYNHTQYMIKCW